MDGRHQPGIPDVIHDVDSYPRYSDFVHNGPFEAEKTSNDLNKAHDEIEKLREDLKDANASNFAITTNEEDGKGITYSQAVKATFFGMIFFAVSALVLYCWRFRSSKLRHRRHDMALRTNVDSVEGAGTYAALRGSVDQQPDIINFYLMEFVNRLQPTAAANA